MSFIAAAVTAGAGAAASIYGANKQLEASQAATQAIQAGQQQGISAVQGYTGQGAGAIGKYTTEGATSLADYITNAVRGLTPFAGVGTSAIPALQSLITPGPGQMEALAQTPGFMFTRDWGMRGINNAATTTGLGGNVLKAGADYSSGLAQKTWQDNVSNLLAALGVGAGAAGQGASAFTTGGLGLSSLYGGAGSSLSGLYGGAGSAISGIVGTGSQNLAQLAQGQGGVYAGAAGGVGNAIGGVGNILMLKNLLAARGGLPNNGLPEGVA